MSEINGLYIYFTQKYVTLLGIKRVNDVYDFFLTVRFALTSFHTPSLILIKKIKKKIIPFLYLKLYTFAKFLKQNLKQSFDFNL
jgi:hypothetical protein